MDAENPLLVDTGRGFSVSYKNRNLYNIKDPVDSAERKAMNFDILPGTVVFIPSPLLFYGVDKILENMPENCLVMGYETDHQLLNLHTECGISPPDDNRFIYLSQTDKAVKALSERGLHRFRRVSMISLSGGYLLNRKKYTDIINQIEGILKEYWQNRMTSIHMSPLWIKNIFFNIFEIITAASKRTRWDFSGLENNSTVLVAGAGESLESSLDMIKDNRNEIVVLAVDTAVSTLVKYGITPDYIIAVDAQVFNYFDFIGLKDCLIPLLFDITCYPPIARNFKGPLLPFLSNFSDNSLIGRIRSDFNDLKIVPPLGSVGITAVHIALLLTSGPVIHTGLDFSYALGKYHAKGTPFLTDLLSASGRFNTVEDMDLYFKRPFKTVLDKNGRECITNTILSTYASVMNNYFSQEARLFDLGGSGIPSAGLRINSIKEVTTVRIPPDSGVRTYKPAIESILSGNSFLEKELKRIEELYNNLYAFLSGRSKEDTKPGLTGMDYLHMHFPDFPPEDPPSPDYIKRVLVSADHYRKIISNLLSITLENGKKG